MGKVIFMKELRHCDDCVWCDQHVSSPELNVCQNPESIHYDEICPEEVCEEYKEILK